MIELKNVSCSYENGDFTAVSPLCGAFEKGKRYAIVGESGSGKTTLARMIAGLQTPTTGNLYLDNKPVYQKKRVSQSYYKDVQMVAQNSVSALNPKLTVAKLIEEPLLCFRKMSRKKREESCNALLELCNLEIAHRTRLPKELSGGQQKRVAIARALAAQPDFLILDEATNGFDMPLRKKMVSEIVLLQEKLGFGMIFITHDMELALAISDEIVVMQESIMVETVSFMGDISAFKHPYSLKLLESANFI